MECDLDIILGAVTVGSEKCSEAGGQRSKVLVMVASVRLKSMLRFCNCRLCHWFLRSRTSFGIANCGFTQKAGHQSQIAAVFKIGFKHSF